MNGVSLMVVIAADQMAPMALYNYIIAQNVSAMKISLVHIYNMYRDIHLKWNFTCNF